MTHVFPPRLIEERLAALVRSALVEARREGIADIRRLSILTSADRFDSLVCLLRDDGYTIGPVTCGEFRSPEWTFAYGLATWSVAPLGLRLS